MEKVLIVNHNHADACGVYKHGKRMADILKKSTKYEFIEVRCNSYGEYLNEYNKHQPKVCFYNYYPGTMNWIHDVFGLPSKHIGLAHEISHDSGPQGLFNQWIVTDPSFPRSDYYIPTVRPIYEFEENYQESEVPIIGSFGFAFPNKGFEKIVSAVCSEFNSATIRFHITIAAFNGGFGHDYLNSIITNCNNLLKPGINLEITTDYKDDMDLVSFLSQNTINCLFYDYGQGRGISSAVDYCISSGRPLCLTHSEQFRHIQSLVGYYPAYTIKHCMNNTQVIKDIKQSWNHEVFINQYEDIVSGAL